MRSSLTSALLFLVACDAITQPPASPAPVNTCVASTDCAAYAQDAGAIQCATTGDGGGACQMAPSSPYILIVTVPTLAPTVSAGATYALTSDTLFTTKAVQTVNACATGSPSPCFMLAPLVVVTGMYVIGKSQAIAADRPVSRVADGGVTLPVATTFWPEWLAPGASAPTDVRYLNLPLPPIDALVGPNYASSEFGVNALGYLPPSGVAGGAIEWVAGLPPLPGAAPYNGIVQVAPPFNDGYPDTTYGVATNLPVVSFNPLPVPPISPPIVLPAMLTLTPFEEPSNGLGVARADGKPLGEGWTVYLRDHVTQNVLSSRATLGATDTVARVNVFENVSETSVEFVLEPPAGVGLPELVGQNLTFTPTAGLIPYPMLQPVTYPLLPPVVHVSGTVRSPDKTAISSALLFYSTSIDSCHDGAIPAATSANAFYEARVETADQLSATGGVGAFSVDLPQGRYEVVIDPSPASGYAKTTLTSLAPIEASPAECGGPTRTLDNVVIEASAPIVLTGTVVTADGRPVANADVDFTPSAALAPSLNPAGLGPIAPATPFTTVTAQDAWPRPVHTTTGAVGGFRMEVDPYSQYDLTIRPQGGTAFPWTVRPNHVLYDQDLSLDPIVVPAPFFLSLTLHDPSDNALASAVVQAYAFTTVSTNGVTTSVALPIGEALTDANGQFTMMLTTSFAP